MNAVEMKEMLLQVSRTLVEKEGELCELDGYVGDGDHGTTVARGFRAAEEMLQKEEQEFPAGYLDKTGHTLSISMGGAAGPLIGGFFQAGTKRIKEKKDLDADDMAGLLADGLKRIQLLGDAKEGDRTMVDALAPASRAAEGAAREGKDITQVLKAAYEAAEEGAQQTKNMKAQNGRARFLGDKSLGYVDAGAVTMSLILKTMYEYMVNREERT